MRLAGISGDFHDLPPGIPESSYPCPVDVGPYRKLSPTLLFLVILAGVGITYILLPSSDAGFEEPWLSECRTNLDEIIVVAEGDRLAAGEGYLSCPAWPEEVPTESVRWDRVDRRCCAACSGTWESFCDFEGAQWTAQACWTSCAEESAGSDDSDRERDWTNQCCAACGGDRAVRCTVAADDGATDKERCIRDCEIDDRDEDPPSCWWELGFEPGVGMRGQYEVRAMAGTSSFEAICRIRRKTGEVLEFEVAGRSATSVSP